MAYLKVAIRKSDSRGTNCSIQPGRTETSSLTGFPFHPIPQLQRTIGNRAVGRLIRPNGPILRAPAFYVARQCDPAWGSLSWDQRVANAQAMPVGAARHQCFTDMIHEGINFPNVSVHQSTNNYATIAAAVARGAYIENGTIASNHVNFDANLNIKTGNPNQFGVTHTVIPQGGNTIRIYIILGPRALNSIGPNFSRMAYEHEQAHASKRLLDWALGAPTTQASASEELEIYTQNFIHYFLRLWTIDNTPPGSFHMGDEFPALFTYYPRAEAAAQNEAFDNIREFYQIRIQRIPCHLMKFKIWLQTSQNRRPAADPLVRRINGLPGLGLARGVNPNTHFHVNVCP